MLDQDFLEVKKENKNNPNKNIVGAVVLVVVLLVGGFFVFKNKAAQKPEEEKREQEIKNIVTPQITRTDEINLQKEMPAGFPKDIPLNGKTKVIKSHSATYPNLTAKQATISFQSSKTPKENYDFYLKWAKDNKWEIINKTDQETSKSLYLRKENKDINLVIRNNISITYVEV